MKITWIGQAGLLIEKSGIKIMVDPYLSDSAKRINPKSYRRAPINEDLFKITPDIMIFTHNHIDHYDEETISKFITEKSKITVLSPVSVWNEVRKFGGNNNYVMFNRYTTWTQCGIKFTAVKAEHSDLSAIGVIIDDGDKKYYITGDTLYNEEIFFDIPKDICAVFLPVNGRGNNMNMEDAKCFSEKINPEYAVPLHCGMFDDIDMNKFGYINKIVPKLYEEIKLK